MKESRAIRTRCPEGSVGWGVVALLWGAPRRPVTFDLMLTVDDSDFTPDHFECLNEWADNLGISVEVLLARIVLATCEGEKYIESVPSWRPTPRE